MTDVKPLPVADALTFARLDMESTEFDRGPYGAKHEARYKGALESLRLLGEMWGSGWPARLGMSSDPVVRALLEAEEHD